MGDRAAPLFVVGCGRSGSTLLRLMLDSHPTLAVPGESHFIPQLWQRHGRGPLDPEALARDLMATPHFGHWKVPREAVWERVRVLGPSPRFEQVVEAAYLANADFHGKTRWGDKTPIYVRSIPLFATLWPDARFVHLLRDGRDVSLSYMSLRWGPSSVWAAARKWRRDVGDGLRHGKPLGTSRYLEVLYEELVADPDAALQEICAFAGLEFAPQMLEPSSRKDHDTLAPEEGRPFHSRSEEDVREGVRDWRSQMSDDDVRAFEAVAGELLGDLGYERRFPNVPAIDRVEGAMRVGALNLVAMASDTKKLIARRFGG